MDIVQSILPPQNRLTGSNEVDGQNRFATTHNQMSQWQSHAIFHSWRVGNAIFARFTLKCVLIGLNLERDKKHKRKKKTNLRRWWFHAMFCCLLFSSSNVELCCFFFSFYFAYAIYCVIWSIGAKHHMIFFDLKTKSVSGLRLKTLSFFCIFFWPSLFAEPKN